MFRLRIQEINEFLKLAIWTDILIPIFLPKKLKVSNASAEIRFLFDSEIYG